MLTEFTRMFSPSEIKKIRSNYNNKSIIEIVEIFRVNCEIVKSNVLDSRWEIESKFNIILAESSVEGDLSSKLSHFNNNFKNDKLSSSINDNELLNTSYKFVNDKIYKLKKQEFDFSNLCEVVKNYILVQEIIVNYLFKENVQYEKEETKHEEFKAKLDVVDELLAIVENTLFYKIDEMEEDSVVLRKIIIRLLLNQKQYLLFGE